jgi:hypothetical protein
MSHAPSLPDPLLSRRFGVKVQIGHRAAVRALDLFPDNSHSENGARLSYRS